MHMDGATHQLGNIHRAGDAAGSAVGGQGDMVGTDTKGDILSRHVLGLQSGLLALRQIHADTVDVHMVALVILHQAGVKEVHLRRTDETGYEQVGGVIEDLLRRADLLDKAVAHDNDPVAQGHGLGLVVGNIDKGGVDLLAQLDDLGAHLVTELGVQVGQRLVHQEHLGLTDDGAADGHTLALAAGQSLGLPVQILGDVQDSGGLADLPVDLILGHLLQLQGEGHVLIDGHVGIEGVGLEDHGDITVLGGHIVHQLAVDVQLAAADLLQAGNHPQRGGLTAAGGTDQNDELLVRDVQIELLDRHDALVRHLEICLLLLHGGLALLVLLGLLLVVAVGIDLLDVLQGYSCHAPDVSGPASAALASGPGSVPGPITAGLHTAAPHVPAVLHPFLSVCRAIVVEWRGSS